MILQMSLSSRVSRSANVNYKHGTVEANYYTIWLWMELCPVYGQQDCMSCATFIDKIWMHCEKHNQTYACVVKHCVYILVGNSYPSGTLHHAVDEPRSATRKATVPKITHAIFVLASSHVLTNVIVSQEDTTGWGEKFQHFDQLQCIVQHIRLVMKREKQNC